MDAPSTDREEWADHVSDFFCGHNPDQACQVCYDKALHAFDKMYEAPMTDEDRAVAEFKGQIKSQELRDYVKNLEDQVNSKGSTRLGNIWANFMTAVVLGGITVVVTGTVILLAWGVRELWGVVF